MQKFIFKENQVEPLSTSIITKKGGQTNLATFTYNSKVYYIITI